MTSKPLGLGIFLVLVLHLGIGAQEPSAKDAELSKKLIGTWDKRLAAPMTLRADGTYSQGLARGTWKVSEGKLVKVIGNNFMLNGSTTTEPIVLDEYRTHYKITLERRAGVFSVWRRDKDTVD